MGTAIPILLFIIVYGYHMNASILMPNIAPLQFLFMPIAFVLPLFSSTYSIVGEKVENTMEPLLATPTTDKEILLGKDVGAMLPSMASIFLGAIVYLVLIDASTYSSIGYLALPTWSFGITILIDVPLAAYFITRLSVILSARSKSVQSAQAYGRVVFIVLLVPIWLSYLGLFSVTDIEDLFIVAVLLLLGCFVLFRLSSSTFNREEILTRWK